MLPFLLSLVVACTPSPPTTWPKNVKVVAVREAPSGLEVEWSLISDFGPDGATTPPRDGTISAELTERSVFDRAAGAMPICTATVDVKPTDFRGDHGWTALTTFTMQPTCPPPSTSPDDYRQLTLWFRMGNEAWQGSIDPPPGMTTPTLMMAGVERRSKEREADAARAPGELKAKADAARPTLAAYVATIGAVEPLLPKGPPPAALGSCGAVAGATAPLIDHDELVHAGGGYGPEVRPHLTSPDLLQLITLATGQGDYQRIVDAAAALDETLDLFWVRVTFDRTPGHVIPASSNVPSSFEPGRYHGALYLAGRKPARVICGVELRATNSAEVSAEVTVDHGQTYVATELDDNLDLRIRDVVEDARKGLVGDALTFPRPSLDR